ncbi:phosphotransferase [Formosa sediminum]|uniref:Phosphotransferase n=1 Tax=Formosa sediminum TaxID=2594004 RepID=A0A516GVD6_9FLAO|nr:fructosamine kinase family protein [Formosa sediminum]QDO95477.1 phosphotransferase [Formosa sediminum]
MFILDANAPEKLAHYLKDNQWLSNDDYILSLTKAGEGNMNYVLRVTTKLGTFIIKQSRGYVEKYPQIKAPEKRVLTEAEFYTKISSVNALKQQMPKILGLDAFNNILLLEDLGKASDFNSMYTSGYILTKDETLVLVAYLNVLHTKSKKEVSDNELANLEMRKLNYEHIFHYPFLIDNGFDLDSIQDGLQSLALNYKTDALLKSKVQELGTHYMAKGCYLLHGDYYPASWLSTSNGVKIIDPEFCYYGSREFDLGVFIAHLYISKQPESIIDLVQSTYSDYKSLNQSLLNGFIGIEIMRRLIGLAQLPLQMNLKDKAKLLEFAYQSIIQ